ncbi:uncharacterized protein CC84DRAFT_1079099 [Paraphaeosphaeria sporulosa]|uniref:Uncharacterized protein n=1 Tax=Paraphaeosphaeria sporulosa TaxID=1460663 RepID=A0A177CX72_9PLEO|nr:uncharacterized protein CC84DRAFT_1079099 [Paraphaeosphaeria sporulosa]OAG11801.1 hypothetical protein CC84DRAFT_1079099 [Paraphaeosphaeria sporulosa]
MGLDTQRPPLPAPTEPSTLSSVDNDTSLRDDVDTNVSSRTDKTSYSIPEDGTPVTINTTKQQGGFHKKYPSQTSLLIEYFEGGKSEGKVHSRPSVRVRVTPSSRKNKSATANDHVQITQTTRNTRKPLYTRRVSLGSKPRDELVHHTNTDVSYSDGSNVSSIPPVEIEVLQNASDLSFNGGRFVPMASDISSMPPDSMLEGEPIIKTPGRRRSRSLERDEVLASKDISDTLKAPTRQRSRSLSKERITARVMEKLQQKPTESVSPKSKHRTGSREELTASRKSHRKTSRSRREEETSGISGTESSLLSSNVHRRSGDTQSIRSGVSGTSSINNPKLLATVEDAIKRLILPELTALKEEQRTQKNAAKFETMSRDSTYEAAESTKSRDSSRRRVSKSSSAPHIHGSKPKVVLNRDENDPGTVLSGGSSRHRRSSRGSVSERSYAESTEEKIRHKKSKDSSRHSTRDAALAGLAASGLTAAALKGHTAREEEKAERKERRKRHSKSRSRTASISESIEDEVFETPFTEPSVPPLPILQSELQGSELTRDSILSAETETRERPESSSSRHTGAETPLREVARGFASPSPRTPTLTPNTTTQRSLGTAHSNHSQGALSAKSDRSYFSRTRETSTAAQEAAAAAKARAIERAAPHSPQYEIAEATPTRGLSPIQSEASYREEVLETGSPRQLRSVHSGASVSTAGRKGARPQSTLSIQSFESSPSTKAARTRKRPQGVSLERTKEVLGEPDTPRDVDEFFEKNHEQNEQYRREYEASLRDSPGADSRRMTGYSEEGEGPYPERDEQRLSLSQDIRKVGLNPEYVHTPLAVESAVASLLEPSSISIQSSTTSPVKGKSRLSRVSPSPDYQHIAEGSELSELHEHPSQERWNAIRGQAQTLAGKSGAGSSPRQSLSVSLQDEPQMNHSAIPTGYVEPEYGYGVDDESEVITNPSIINGPGGAQYDDRTEELLSRQEEREQRTPSRSYGKAAAAGAAAGLAAAAAARSRNESPMYDQQRDSMASDNYELHYDQHEPLHSKNSYSRERTPSRSPALWKDEGYQSAHQPGAHTPDMRHQRLYDGEMDEYDESPLDGGDPFSTPDAKHARHLSGNSHGMASPLYDSATGKGLDRIESKDIVALMDHLTVRDAQRNARDTEILVTLVRSAAEMRNTFEELKQFIRVQDSMVMNHTDKRVDLAEQRIIGGPRPQPAGSPRAPRSSADDLDYETKKKNVFKRALKGLGSKGDKDIKNIEAMLMQLLGDVEGLKQVHQLTLDQQRTNSMTSYEHMRANDPGAPESGYEPEGRANTASSPNQSGYLSNPSTSRRIQDLHSGYDVPQTQRISTVHEEDDEEYLEDEPQYENTERMTTPTQEARRNNSLSHDTPPQAAKPFRESQSQENTPKRKHKSNSSSIFGIPKISRWSKTTASTNRDSESLPRNSGSGEERRPYSSGSRSGSRVNIPFGDGQYEMNEDDRMRSTASLPRDGRDSVRSPSPLIPEDTEQYAMEDPKYQAHRNSLNLQHPQPKHGPTGRHTNQLDQQARIFDPVRSPDYSDQWGSNPSLARNRMSGGGASYNAGNLSPISSEGGYSQHSASEQQAPPRPPKILDDGPLIPPQQPLAGHGQARQMYSSPNEYGGQGTLTPLAPIQEVRYSLETDRGVRYTPTPSPRPSSQNLSITSPQRKITGPRPMGSRSPQPQHGQTELQHSDTVIRRKPVAADTESLESYRSSLDSEIF